MNAKGAEMREMAMRTGQVGAESCVGALAVPHASRERMRDARGPRSMAGQRKRCREMASPRLLTRGIQTSAVRNVASDAVVVMLPRVWATEAVADERQAESSHPDVALQFYRKYTEALLRRYQRLKLQAGRVPSRMDREMFRGKMSHYRVEGFEDRVIFCVDVERCLGRLSEGDKRLVQRIAVQEYSMGEAAAMLGTSLRSCVVLYGRAVDRMTRLFLEAKLLTPPESLSRGCDVSK